MKTHIQTFTCIIYYFIVDRLETAAKLLQLEATSLASALVHREVRVRGQEKTFANLDTTQASDSRHALCKFVYGRMFDWLVERINRSMKESSKSTSSTSQYIGILDIFGFEIFEHNSFEQLCINFTNEMLQQHFNNNTFKLEEEIYVNEGITWDAIDFIDNEPMIELITKKRIGILPMLDEELKLPGGSDVKFLARLQDKQSRNQVMVKTRQRNAFCVRHFAGEVTYDVLGFLEKNRDTLTEDLVDMLRSSKHPYLKSLYPDDEAVSTSSRKASLAKQFQKQLKDLMGQLYATEPHYIRCIKPNDEKAPLKFVPRNCYEQLTYSGVFEAVAIRKKGFPFRLKHQDFVDRYEKCLKQSDVKGGGTDVKGRAKNIAKCMKLNMKNFQVGRSLVLYRALEYRTLELSWSVVTKHETIKSRLKDLVLQSKSASTMSKADKDDYCMDLAYAVREASLFRIEGENVDKAKKLLDKYIEERMDPQTKQMLTDAIQTKLLQKLRDVLDRCEKKGIEGTMVSECRRLLGLVEDAEGALAFAMGSMEEEHLERAIGMCEEFSYTSSTEKNARKLLKNVIKARKGIKQALKRAPRYKSSMIEKVIKFCNGFGYDTKSFRTLEKVNQKIRGARKTLNKAYDLVDEKKLQAAVNQCSELSFNGTCYECQLVDDCVEMLERIRLINKEAKKAKKQCIAEQVETVVDAAERINLRTETIDYLSDLCNGSKKKYLKKQIEGALNHGSKSNNTSTSSNNDKMKDVARASRCQKELHDFVVNKEKSKLKPSSFDGLKTPMDWGKGSQKRASTMHVWQSSTLSEPMMRKYDAILDTTSKKNAKKLIIHAFNTVQKCMGQRHTSKLPLRMQEIGVDSVMHGSFMPDEIYYSIIKQCTANPATEPNATPSLGSDGLKRAARLLCYCLTIFPPSESFAPHLAYWVRQEPMASLCASYNVNGLLARVCIVGHVKPNSVPRVEDFERTGRVSYTKHWIGSTWNGDGLNEVLDPRLKLDDFQDVVYKSSNASWVSLRRTRRNSASER
jgi:hypothetical protein